MMNLVKCSLCLEEDLNPGLQHPHKMPGMMACACDASTGEAGTGDPLKLTGQRVQPNHSTESTFDERPYLKK